jgi:hypothetical protein
MAAFRGKADDGRRLFASRKHNVAGWSSPVAREAHNLEVAGSNPVPAISSFLVNGVTSEEPAVTRVVAAGSVVSCEGALSRARGWLRICGPSPGLLATRQLLLAAAPTGQ